MEELSSLTKTFNELWHLQLYSSGGQVVHLNQLIIALTLIIIGGGISKRASILLGRRLLNINRLTRNTAYLIQRILFYLLITIITLIALPIAGIPITIFAVMGGAIAIGVGFGAQNLFNNLISGLILMLEKPIRIGDIIDLGGHEGKVEDIGNRCVRVRRTDGIDLIVPNSKFLEDIVINWTLFDNDIRGKVSVGVAYGSPTNPVEKLMLQAAAEHPKVLKTPEATVLFQEFGDNALNFELWFWSNVTRPMDLRKVKSDLRFRIDALFREHDLIIAFPQRDIHLDTSKPLDIRLQSDKTA